MTNKQLSNYLPYLPVTTKITWIKEKPKIISPQRYPGKKKWPPKNAPKFADVQIIFDD